MSSWAEKEEAKHHRGGDQWRRLYVREQKHTGKEFFFLPISNTCTPVYLRKNKTLLHFDKIDIR